jgi:hypothetical protein
MILHLIDRDGAVGSHANPTDWDKISSVTVDAQFWLDCRCGKPFHRFHTQSIGSTRGVAQAVNQSREQDCSLHRDSRFLRM